MIMVAILLILYPVSVIMIAWCMPLLLMLWTKTTETVCCFCLNPAVNYNEKYLVDERLEADVNIYDILLYCIFSEQILSSGLKDYFCIQ